MTDLEFIRDPDLWPQWPFCPLKRTVNAVREHAYLYGGARPTLYHGNIFRADPQTDRHEEYASYEAIVAAGWRVD